MVLLHFKKHQITKTSKHAFLFLRAACRFSKRAWFRKTVAKGYRSVVRGAITKYNKALMTILFLVVILRARLCHPLVARSNTKNKMKHDEMNKSHHNQALLKTLEDKRYTVRPPVHEQVRAFLQIMIETTHPRSNLCPAVAGEFMTQSILLYLILFWSI